MAQDLSTTPRRAALLALALAATLLVTVLVQMRTPDRSDAGAGAALDGSGARVDDAATAAGPTGEVLLAFAGEVHLEGVLEGLADQPGSTLGPLSRALSSADLAVLNLESAITDGTTDRARKELEVPGNRYWFDAPPSVLDLMDRSGVDVVSMANNHGADHGRAGLRTALDAAADSPVAVVGIGRTPEQAYAPHRVEVDGVGVAVLAADASPRESADPTWAIGPGTGVGIAAARRPGAPALVRAVESAAAGDDLVVVYLHWGAEGRATPTAKQQDLARTLAEAGADVVVGSHAHVLLGSGLLGETYVSYGLGNFAWYHGRQSETGVLRLRVRVEDGAARVVGEQWWPGVIPPGGGVPQALPRSDRPAAVGAWRALRRGTGLAAVPGAGGQQAEQRDGQQGEQGGAEVEALPAYVGRVRRLDAATRARMLGVSHRPASCPVRWADLRLLTLSYVGFDGVPGTGEMVVHRDVARDVVEVFEELYEGRFPIRRMELVDAYDGDDDASMAANNTSAYNCRTVAGTDSLSDHAYGRAVDINPVQNPYVLPDEVLPPAGRRFVDVDRSAGAQAPRGVLVREDVVVRAFTSRGWEWGGLWRSPDWQHFSAG
ncbi:CapA family protein [Nocardioides sp.]|uniref:CapA family protein n=1 Tax=Nocardioides sp. TaxID=35761 RepID=UPI003518A78B